MPYAKMPSCQIGNKGYAEHNEGGFFGQNEGYMQNL